MGKYTKLGVALKINGNSSQRMTFSEIEKIINDNLPPSLYKYEVAWYGSFKGSPTHVWKKAWEEWGYTTEKVDLKNEYVIFRKL